MSRLFLAPNQRDEKLETTLLSEVGRINFHTSNYAVAESVALNFKNNDMLIRFSPDFLKTVYDKLIEPARIFGYYYGSMPKSEQCEMIRTSSAYQYDGNDEKFSAACIAILRAIDEERTRREQVEKSNFPRLP